MSVNISEVVTITIASREFEPLSVAVRRSLEDAAGTYECRIPVMRQDMEGWHDILKSGPVVKITANGTLVFTGHHERAAPRIQAESGELSVSGRSKTGDAVDSAADDVDGREHKNKKPGAMIEAIGASINIKVVVETDADARPLFRLEPDDTIVSAADRWARLAGFAVTDDAEGNLRIYDAAKAKRHAGALIEGDNISDGSAVHDLSKRFSETKVKAQSADGSGPERLEIETLAGADSARRNEQERGAGPRQIPPRPRCRQGHHRRDFHQGLARRAR
jgi:prophage tail gpP-like protein